MAIDIEQSIANPIATDTSPKKASPHSAPDTSLHNRRHSLPVHFLPPNLWNNNIPTASLVKSEEAARGEHILDEPNVAYRISALRQLNGATRSHHQYAKSTGAQNSTFSQPVIVRTYSGPSKPRSTPKEPEAKKKRGMGNAKLPPIEAFSFKGIMDSIGTGVADDLERIAEICARSRYSLSNQYEVHMQPHGTGETFLQTPGQSSSSQANSGGGSGPTLQAIGSDNEHPPHRSKPARSNRRGKSAAYGTLETIISSSRSSEEEKSKKKPAAELAEKVRGRSISNEARVGTDIGTSSEQTGSEENSSSQKISSLHHPIRHRRTKSAPFASLIIDNAAQHLKPESSNPTNFLLPTTPVLTSEPAKPKTSTVAEFSDIQSTATPSSEGTSEPFPIYDPIGYSKPSMIRNESIASTLTSEPVRRVSIFSGFSSWMPWARSAGNSVQGARRPSYAEGSLRDLLRGSVVESNRKGKGVDRGV